MANKAKKAKAKAGFQCTCLSWSSVSSLELVYGRWIVESGINTELSLAVGQIAS